MASDKAVVGRFLAEISEVKYLGEDEVKSDMQYGTIIVRNKTFQHEIYKVEDMDKGRPSIKKDDQLRLTGPLSSIGCPSGYILIEADLFFGAYEEAFPVYWIPRKDDDCFYYKETIKVGNEPKISIYFGMFYKAAEAKIEVSLLPKNDFPVDVVSVIAYHIREDTKDNEETKFSSLLFSKPGDSGVRVQSVESTASGKDPSTSTIEGEPWKLIPLARSIVAVPLKYGLHVDIVLSNGEKHDLDFDVNVDDVKKPQDVGENYDIKATVIWNPVHETKPAFNESCSDEYYEEYKQYEE